MCGGGKGILVQEEKTGALSTLNNQSVCYRKTGHPRNTEEPQGYEEAETSDTMNGFDITETRVPTLVCDARGNGAGGGVPR